MLENKVLTKSSEEFMWAIVSGSDQTGFCHTARISRQMRAAIDHILQCPYSGNGSSLIFDYTYPDVIAGTFARKEDKEWLKITQKSDEPIVFGISQDNIEKFLDDRGFSNVVSVSADYFNSTYFAGVNRGRESTPVLSVAHAQIEV